MSKVDEVFIIIDTNIALHFHRLDKISWESLIPDKRITIIIAPILVRELERNKAHNSSKKLRQRATKYIAWLTSILENEEQKEIRKNTSIKLLDRDPTIDFNSFHLLPSISDDFFIATAIDLKQQEIGPLFFITNDLGLKMKLRARNIEYLTLPEKFAHTEEQDPLERENAELKKKIQEIQSKEPKFRLLINNSSGPIKFKIKNQLDQLSSFIESGLSEIKRQYPLLVAPDNEKSQPLDKIGKSFDLSSLQYLSNRLTKEQADKYNDELLSFFKKNEEYLANLWNHKERCSLSGIFFLSLTNSGTAQASDIDIVIRFPSFIRLYEPGCFSSEPKAPNPPAKPGTIKVGDMLSRNLYELPGLHHSLDPSIFRNLKQINPSSSGPNISEKNHQIKFWIKTLKHHMQFKFEPFIIGFESRDLVNNFSVSYDIYSVEAPHPTSGEIHFIIDKS